MMDDEKHLFSETDPGSRAIQMPKPIKGTGRYPPSIILEQHSTISSSDSAFAPLPAGISGATLFPPPNQNLLSVVMPAPAPVRLASSALLNPTLQTTLSTPTSTPLALEAILLERKRRLVASSNNASICSTPVSFGPCTTIPPSPAPPSLPGGSTAVPLTSASGGGSVSRTSGKGMMFKSSPLSDKVVAEQ